MSYLKISWEYLIQINRSQLYTRLITSYEYLIGWEFESQKLCLKTFADRPVCIVSSEVTHLLSRLNLKFSIIVLEICLSYFFSFYIFYCSHIFRNVVSTRESRVISTIETTFISKNSILTVNIRDTFLFSRLSPFRPLLVNILLTCRNGYRKNWRS